jgi:hypothetical protein|nr:MAG TPA_asm: hypothetical protein [Caudoviricetes sp.]
MLNNEQIPIIIPLYLAEKILCQLYQNNLDLRIYLYYLQDIQVSTICQRCLYFPQFLDNETDIQVCLSRLYFQIHVDYYYRRTLLLYGNNVQ